VFEVTREGEVVWEHASTRTVPELILGILRAERLPADFAYEWVD
jgi:hypothetical protein